MPFLFFSVLFYLFFHWKNVIFIFKIFLEFFQDFTRIGKHVKLWSKGSSQQVKVSTSEGCKWATWNHLASGQLELTRYSDSCAGFGSRCRLKHGSFALKHTVLWPIKGLLFWFYHFFFTFFFSVNTLSSLFKTRFWALGPPCTVVSIALLRWNLRSKRRFLESPRYQLPKKPIGFTRNKIQISRSRFYISIFLFFVVFCFGASSFVSREMILLVDIWVCVKG